MKSDDTKVSPDTEKLKEKIRLKKLDRSAYIKEVETVLSNNRERRNALRVGNECLRYMTMRQEDMTIHLNAEIFAKHPNEEKLRMQKTNLQDSIYINDRKLFKTGKSLLKEDYERDRMRETLEEKKRELKRAEDEKMHRSKEHEEKCQTYLHKQAMVADSNDREVVARLLYQRLQQMKKELHDDIDTYPQRLRQIEKKIVDKANELKDFEELKARGERFLNLELNQLEPLDDELTKVTEHFAKTIAVEKNELEDRRKKSSLAKFLTERDATFFNFVDSSNLMDTKIKARNKALEDAYDTLIALMDAMMVSDVQYVVDCFLDQSDVTKMLADEEDQAERDHARLTAKRDGLVASNEFQTFNDSLGSRQRQNLRDAKLREREELQKHEKCDYELKKLDKLMSDLSVSTHALFEKVRPIKIEEESNNYQGDLVKDIQNFNKKVERMMSVIANNTIPVGSVRPLMLHLFKNKRLPQDSVRVDLQKELFGAAMQSYDFYELDQPGYVTRDYLKARSAQAGSSSKKKGKHGNRK